MYPPSSAKSFLSFSSRSFLDCRALLLLLVPVSKKRSSLSSSDVSPNTTDSYELVKICKSILVILPSSEPLGSAWSPVSLWWSKDWVDIPIPFQNYQSALDPDSYFSALP